MSKINSRKKGHDYERKIRRELRDLGFDECETSRYANRKKDDEKVDLCFTDPFNFQIKATKGSVNYRSILKQMPDDGNYNVVLHKIDRQGEFVCLSKKDFFELILILKQEEII